MSKIDLSKAKNIVNNKNVVIFEILVFFISIENLKIFNLKPGRQVGQIKKTIENAILDGEIENQYDAAYEFMMKIDIS